MATSASTAEGPYFAGHGTKPYRAFVLGMLLLVYTFNFIDRVAIDILQEQIKKEFGLLDAQLGLLVLHLSMGQLLCLVMLAVAALLWQQRKTAPARTTSGQQRRSAPRR